MLVVQVALLVAGVPPVMLEVVPGGTFVTPDRAAVPAFQGHPQSPVKHHRWWWVVAQLV